MPTAGSKEKSKNQASGNSVSASDTQNRVIVGPPATCLSSYYSNGILRIVLILYCQDNGRGCQTLAGADLYWMITPGDH